MLKTIIFIVSFVFFGLSAQAQAVELVPAKKSNTTFKVQNGNGKKLGHAKKDKNNLSQSNDELYVIETKVAEDQKSFDKMKELLERNRSSLSAEDQESFSKSILLAEKDLDKSKKELKKLQDKS